MEPRSWTGDWWVAGSEDQQVAGTLQFDPDSGVSLDLFGSLDRATGPLEKLGMGVRREPVIHGVTHKGVEITLLDTLVVAQAATMSRWLSEKETWTARRALIGTHADSADSVLVNELTVGFDGMRSWVGRAPIDVQDPSEPRLKWLEPPSYASTDVGLTFQVRHSPAIQIDLDSVTLRDDIKLAVTLPDDVSLENLLGYLQPLRNFAAFVLDDATFFRYVGCVGRQLPGHRRGFEGTEGERMDLIPIEVLFEQVGKRKRKAGIERPLFTLAASPVPFDSLGARWLAISEEHEIGGVLSQFFGLQYAPPEFSEVRFSVLVNALEEYHRRRVGGTAMPAQDFDDLRGRILEAMDQATGVSGKERQWLKGKLKRLNDLALETRLRDLVESQREALSSLIGNPPAFAKRVADTRNYFSHGESSLKDQAAGGIEIYFLARCLRQLLVSLLLAEVGADGAATQKVLSGNDQHRWLIEKTRDYPWAIP